MLETGKLVPNVPIVALDGSRLPLWEYRQQCHLILLVGDRSRVEDINARLAERAKTLTWLNVRVLAAAEPPEGFPPGAYAIDRYGELMSQYALDETLPDRVEKDFLYYEACHC